jgi:hypothetical protein
MMIQTYFGRKQRINRIHLFKKQKQIISDNLYNNNFANLF